MQPCQVNLSPLAQNYYEVNDLIDFLIDLLEKSPYSVELSSCKNKFCSDHKRVYEKSRCSSVCAADRTVDVHLQKFCIS